MEENIITTDDLNTSANVSVINGRTVKPCQENKHQQIVKRI
jgi:hypothetical protein